MKYFPKRLNMTWIKKSYEDGSLTPLELAEEIVKRAEENIDKNIWIVPPTMELMMPYIKRLENVSYDSLPLWGMPFAIKDNINLENVPTTAACKEYEYIPKESAAVVEKLIEMGAIPVGKTNLDQFATGLVGTRSPYGEVHNSLNDDFISGGSSSGSAVAVGLGMAAFSLGTDTAGSGRVPAALNCLVGYKPSVGAWSSRGVVPACASLDCVTVFANNLEDAKLVNKYARGFDNKCCWSKEFPEPLPRLPEKIFIPKTVEFFGNYADIFKEKWEKAAARMEKMGIEVEYIDTELFSRAASILYDGPWVAERWADLGEFVENNPDAVFPVTKTVLSSGGRKELTAASCFKAVHELAEYEAQTRKILKNSVLVMPTAGGTYTRDEVRNDPIKTNSNMGLYTNHCNLLDLCAVAVPENSRDFEMPFGITIFALAENEGIMLGMAEKFMALESVELAVCGLHLKGFSLEYQLKELGAEFVEHTETSENYRLKKLNTEPVKPALIRCGERGCSIDVDIYSIPVDKLGAFLMNIPSPLVLGKVELKDGRKVTGFLCESGGAEEAVDITEYKGFKKYTEASEAKK